MRSPISAKPPNRTSGVAVFRAHLTKEWRENRGAVLGLLGVIVVGAPVLVELVRRAKLPTQDLPGIAGLMVVALGLFTLGGEVLGRELASDRRSALTRLPGGLARPFAARLAVFFAATIGLAAVAYAWTGALQGGFGSEAAWSAASVGWRVSLAVVLTGWTLAASCWLRQGMLAAPAGAVLLAALVVAPALPWSDTLREALRPRDVVTLAVLIGVTGYAAAWASFSRGLRRGGSRLAAVSGGTAVLVAGCLPVYAIAGSKAHAWLSLDLVDGRLQISRGVVGAGDRFAFLQLDHLDRRPAHAVALDLHTGEIRDLGASSWLRDADERSNRPAAGASSTELIGVVRVYDESAPLSWLDAATAETVASADFGPRGFAPLPVEVADRLRAEARAATTWRDPSGRRMWMLDGRLEVEGRTDEEGDRIPREYRLLHRLERGAVFLAPSARTYGRRVYVDFAAGEEVALPDWGGWTDAVFETADGVMIRRSESEEDATGRAGGSWWLHRPGATDLEPLPNLDADGVVLVLADGRLLVTRDAGVRVAESPRRRYRARRVELLDPRSGAREPVSVAAGELEEVAGLGTVSRRGDHEDRALLRVWYARGSRLARLDVEGRRLELLDAPIFQPISTRGDEVVGISDDSRRLLRARFGGDEVEVLFELGASRP